MRTIRYILRVVHFLPMSYLGVGMFFLFLFSCTWREESPQLLRIDSLMNSQPDSALLLLESIVSPQKLSGSERALYALLLTQARYKNYVTLNDDSLIKIAVDYYGSEEKNFRAAQAYYYWGAIYRDKGNIPFAVEQYLKAIDLMPEQNAFLAMMYNNLGDCYQAEDLYDMSLEAYRKAHQISQVDNKVNYFSFKGMARLFILRNQLDSALYYLQKASDGLIASGDSAILSEIYFNFATIFHDQKDNARANDYISKVFPLLDSDRKRTAFHLKAWILLEQNQLDSARYYFEQGRDINDIYRNATYYDGLYQIEKKLGNWKAVAQNIESYMALYDSIQLLSDSETLDRLADNHDLEAHKRALLHKQKEFTEKLVIGLLFVVLSGVFLLLWIDRKRKNSYILLQQKLAQKRVDAMLLYSKEPLEHVKGYESELIELREQQFNLCLSIFKTTEYYEKLQDLETTSLKQLKSARALRAELNDVIRKEFIDVMESLKKCSPTLTNDDLFYCILSLLSCSKYVVMELMNVSPDALKMRKSRIKSKMGLKLFEYVFSADNQ